MLETAVAAWIVYLARSQPAFGAAWEASDPLMPFVADIARQSSGDIGVFTKLFIGNRSIFGDTLAEDAAFIRRIASAAQLLLADGVARSLGRAMTEAPPPA